MRIDLLLELLQHAQKLLAIRFELLDLDRHVAELRRVPTDGLAVGIFALALFGYAQHQGWNMFDNVANPGSGKSGGGSRIYHK